MMAMVIGITLAALCVVVAAFPFFLTKRRVPSQPTDPLLELQHRRQAIYQEVRAIYNDYSLGAMTQSEYEERLHSHRLQAATMLLYQERLQELDFLVEKEVLYLRSGVCASDDGTPCPECGRHVEDTMNQCHSCGTLLLGTVPDG